MNGKGATLILHILAIFAGVAVGLKVGQYVFGALTTTSSTTATSTS